MSNTKKVPVKIRRLKACLVTATALSIASGSNAATPLEEVLVTAQKREQNLQDVPISVAFVSGDKIVESNLNTFEDLSQSIPNLTVANVANITAIIIRGIGTGDNRGFEQSVGLFVDGVHKGRERQVRATHFLDVSAVEVLRGPQGTLFGKNTTAGALIVTSARPSDEFEAGYTGTYTLDSGDHNGSFKNEFMVSGALSETLNGRLALRHTDDEGYYKNVFLGSNAQLKEEQAARLSLEWFPSNEFSALLQYEFGDADSTGLPIQVENTSRALIGGLKGLDLDLVSAVYGGPLAVDKAFTQFSELEQDDTNSESFTLTLNYELGDYSLTAITGYNEYDYVQNRDGDRIAQPLFAQVDQEDYKAYSQEIRLTSNLEGDVNYILGAFIQKWDLTSRSRRDFFLEPLGLAIGIPENYSIFAGLGNATQARFFDAESETAAVFANLDWGFAEDFNLNVGARFSYETKEAQRSSYLANLGSFQRFQSAISFSTPLDQAIFYGTLTQINPVLGQIASTAALTPTQVSELAVGMGQLNLYAHDIRGDRSASDFSPSVRVDWDVADSYMLYAGITRGFKSGGFDEQGSQGDQVGQFNPALGPAGFEFDDEVTTSYEVGGKGTFLNGALNANWAAFYTVVDDSQFSRFIPGEGFAVGNSGQVDYRGLEVDTQWQINEHWRLDFSAANLRAIVVDPVTINGAAQQRSGPSGDAEWTANASLSYKQSVFKTLNVSASLSWDFRDNRFIESHSYHLPAQRKYDFRLALGDNAGAWELAVLAQNLSNERLVLTTGENALLRGMSDVYLRPPRSLSVQFSYNF